jgi:hypothetical protein
MVVSAFLAGSDLAVWMVLALLGIGVTARALGAGQTFALVASAHVLAQIVSEGVLWFQIRSGALPLAQEHILDVGPSYVVISALAAGTFFGGPEPRPNIPVAPSTSAGRQRQYRRIATP